MYKVTRHLLTKDILNTQQLIRPASIKVPTSNRDDENVKPWSEIPGPKSFPIVGQMPNFLPGGWLYKKTIELQALLHENYGPIVRIDGNIAFDPITFLFDPDSALEIFRKEDVLPIRPGFDSLLYHRKQYFNKTEDDPLALLFGSGKGWKELRTTVNPVMLQPQSIKQYADTMEEVAEDMIVRLKRIRNKENKIDNNFYTELSLWALESIAAVALGDRIRCFDPDLPDDSPNKRLVLNVHSIMATSEKLDFQPSPWKYITTPNFRKVMKICDENIELNTFFINKALKKLEGKNRPPGERSILERLIEIDRDIAVVLAGDMLFAGVETASNTMIGLLYLLAKNPDKQDKLRAEIMSKPDNYRYTKACIKEAMRLYPVVGGNFRQTRKEHNILGYKIPAGMNVILGNAYLCRQENQYPRANEFLPERWIVDKNDPLHYGSAHPFIFAPYGTGSRTCVGRRIADMELEAFTIKMIEAFRVDWFGEPPRRERRGTINYFILPYNFILNDA